MTQIWKKRFFFSSRPKMGNIWLLNNNQCLFAFRWHHFAHQSRTQNIFYRGESINFAFQMTYLIWVFQKFSNRCLCRKINENRMSLIRMDLAVRVENSETEKYGHLLSMPFHCSKKIPCWRLWCDRVLCRSTGKISSNKCTQKSATRILIWNPFETSHWLETNIP